VDNNSDPIIEKLKKVSIFEYLVNEPEALEMFKAIISKRSFLAGSAVIKEGEEGDELFILYTGTVEVAKNTLAKDLYTVTKLTAENHAFFGEIALIDNDTRSATVFAKTDCELLVIKKQNFLELGEKNNRIGLMITRKIAQIISQRLRRSNQDVITLYEALVGEIEGSS
jgi:CRP/FNR family cyclic AMP-dependent transcriptional regulator